MKTKLLLSLLLAISFTNVSYASTTLNYVKPTDLEQHCRAKLPLLPYAFDATTRKFYTFNAGSSSESAEANPSQIISTTAKLEDLNLLEACRCNSYISKRGIFGAETTNVKRSSWAGFFLNDICEHTIVTKINSVQGGGITSIEYCGIEKSEYESRNMTLAQFKDIDQNNNCRIDGGRETCKMNLVAAQVKCQANPQANIDDNLNPVTGNPATELGISRSCSNLPYFGCLSKDKPEYLDIEPGYTAESLDVNKVLKTDGQIGFQGIDDQGAGTNNPAINFLLYIINTLANLSFLVAVFMLIMAGFYTVIASGNTESTDRAKSAIIYFVMAVACTLLSYSIVAVIKALIYS